MAHKIRDVCVFLYVCVCMRGSVLWLYAWLRPILADRCFVSPEQQGKKNSLIVLSFPPPPLPFSALPFCMSTSTWPLPRLTMLKKLLTC